MELPSNLSINRVMEVAQEDENVGFCMACGEERGNVEPDARHYHCDSCGEDQVFGAEEIILNFL